MKRVWADKSASYEAQGFEFNPHHTHTHKIRHGVYPSFQSWEGGDKKTRGACKPACLAEWTRLKISARPCFKKMSTSVLHTHAYTTVHKKERKV